MKTGKIYIGPSGLYKTFNLVNFAKEKENESYYTDSRGTYKNIVRYYTASQITDLVKRGEKTIDQIASCHTLCIDDLGKESKLFGDEVVAAVIQRFYDFYFQHTHIPLTLMITSNLTMKDIAERYGLHISDRIVELCEVVKVVGESARMKTYQTSTITANELKN
jgi:DNA replication protein DnaC